MWGAISGVAYFSIYLGWWLSAYPLDWAGINSNIFSFIFIFVTYLAIVFICASFFALFTCTLRSLSVSGHLLGVVIGAPCLWTLYEYLRALVYSLFWTGQGALIGAHWAFGNLGYILHNVTALRSLASMGGVYLLSFLIVLISALLVATVICYQDGQINLSRRYGVVFLVIFLSWWFTGTILNSKIAGMSSMGQIKVAVMGTYFPRGYVGDLEYTLNHVIALRSRLVDASASAELVIMPEGSGFLQSLEADSVDIERGKIFFESIKQIEPVVLMDSIESREAGVKFKHTRLLYFDSKDGLVDYYDKRLIFPGGEYVPQIVESVLRVAGQSEVLEAFKRYRVLAPGERVSVVANTRFGKIGGLICSAILSPELGRGMVNNGAELLVVVSSLALFEANPIMQAENRAMSQIRAIETGRDYLVVSNVGESLAIARDGQIVEYIDSGDETKVVLVNRYSNINFYTKYGNWIVWLSLFILLTYWLRQDKSVSNQLD